MKTLHWMALLSSALILGAATPAFSHHSHAMFDHTKDVTLTGTVTAYEFVNPHSSLYIDVVDSTGKKVNYWFEMSNVPNMITRGIGKTTFKYGDKVTVKFHPLRDGRPGGNYVNLTTAEGKLYE